MSPATLSTGAATDTGLLRDRNEDRYFLDPEHGVFLVVDGVGGQAAGELAAQTAVEAIRESLTDRPGGLCHEDRIRAAIAHANNRIFELARHNTGLVGMACVLTLAVLLIFSLLEGWIDRVNQIRNYKIVCDFEDETLHRYEELFTNHHLKFKRTRQTKSIDDMITGEWVVQGSEKNHRHFIHVILKDITVKAFEF